MKDVIIPGFCVIGGARCATSSLYQAMRHHPDIVLTDVKETHYFSRLDILSNLNGPLDKEQYRKLELMTDSIYKQHYNDLKSKSNGEVRIYGDICPSYLSNISASKEIFDWNPKCKIIVIIRNPIERLLSNYRLLVEYNREHESISKAIELESVRIKSGWEWSWRYLDNSLYAKHLIEYLKYFPRENIKIINFNSLITASAVPSDLLKYIGVRDMVLPLKQYNITRSPLPFLRIHRWAQMNSYVYRHVFAIIKTPITSIYDRVSSENVKAPGTEIGSDDYNMLINSKNWMAISRSLNDDKKALNSILGEELDWQIP